ncbi:helix-turn-helix domain-containing protein [Bordetella sp. BOR01]|uniref:helix-turn-helix domain-containing protein n=1 Tax=Bordetella sp. BOR01 TaxID=2854779 RepID=UPI001C47A5E0|nr:helix-turn-helix domain-containing protein [Bordetella sp. BOR01]MBV7484551.1 helix-turn-helix domain-containing protein [Bordetella sp. BOR01]
MQEKPLSNRERDCLHWSALGKTSWETAIILGVSERTVNFHIGNACSKLGVYNRRAAVALALRQGLLPSLID